MFTCNHNELGAYAVFKHEPSAKEVADVSTEILNLIAADLNLFKGVLTDFADYRVIYRYPGYDKGTDDPLKKWIAEHAPEPIEQKWSIGIKVSFSCIMSGDDVNLTLKNCKTRLFEGVSPEPYRIIE